jgi:hypothetical protein
MLEHYLPEIDYSGITGDWRSLPHALMYRISELPVLRDEGRNSIGSASENDTPFDGDNVLHELNSQSCLLGLRAIRISRELRRVCGMPDDGLSVHPWSAWRVLSNVRAGIINADLRYARSQYKTMIALRQLPSPAETGVPESKESISL